MAKTKQISLVDSYYNDGCLMWEAKRYGGLQLYIYSNEAVELVKSYIKGEALRWYEEEDLEEDEAYRELQEAIASKDKDSWYKLVLCYDSEHVDTYDRQGFAGLGCDATDEILDLLQEKYGRPGMEITSNIKCLGFDHRGKGKTNQHWGVWSREVIVDHRGDVIDEVR